MKDERGQTLLLLTLDSKAKLMTIRNFEESRKNKKIDSFPFLP